MHTQLLIIGAGPYGLSLAAFAKKHAIDCIIVGEPMGFWKNNMPQDMLLRSGLDWHLDPFYQLTLRNYLMQQPGFTHFTLPIARQQFVDYAEWFIRQNDIQITNERVTALHHDGTQFTASLADGTHITAINTVVATGFNYFANLPQVVTSTLDKQYYSHTCNTVSFDFLQNKNCIIIGGRQSAFESAALLLEHGCAQVNIVYDHATPKFETSDWDWVDALLELSLHNPGWFSSLTAEEQADIKNRLWQEGRLRLEPWLAGGLQGKNVTMWPLRNIKTISAAGGIVTLHTQQGDVITGDYVLLATGYAINMAAIPFLSAGNVLANVDLKNGYPVLNHYFEASLPGLFFTSFASTQAFGPFFGFVRGAVVTANIIGEYLKGFKL